MAPNILPRVAKVRFFVESPRALLEIAIAPQIIEAMLKIGIQKTMRDIMPRIKVVTAALSPYGSE